jgi:hypothetical protein
MALVRGYSGPYFLPKQLQLFVVSCQLVLEQYFLVIARLPAVAILPR